MRDFSYDYNAFLKLNISTAEWCAFCLHRENTNWPCREDVRRMGGGGGFGFCRSAQQFRTDCSEPSTRYWRGFRM